MQLTMPRDDKKKEIQETLQLTLSNRRKWINDANPTIQDIGDKYPRLFDFNGCMVKFVFYFQQIILLTLLRLYCILCS